MNDRPEAREHLLNYLDDVEIPLATEEVIFDNDPAHALNNDLIYLKDTLKLITDLLDRLHIA
jgi:hypothetical protein